MRGKLLLAGALAAWLTAPAASQDVRNTYIAVAAQIADGIITLAKLTGFGTGVQTALGINVGTAGAVLVKGTSVCADLSNGSGACAQAYTAAAWTPTITTTGTNGTPAYTTQVGSYELVGRQYTVRFNIALSGWTGSPTGNVLVGGLPATSANTTGDTGGCAINYYVASGLAALNYGLTGYILWNASQITVNSNSSTSVTALTAAQAGTTFNIAGWCSFHI